MTAPAGILKGAAVITTSVAPTLGNINRYNATSGSLTPTLPALAGPNVGASCIVEKIAADVSSNTVTFTAHSGDTFDDGATTTLVLQYPGEKRDLQIISVAGIRYWKVTRVSPGTAGVAGTLDGVTIGATTPAASITTDRLLRSSTSTAASGTAITMTITSKQVQIVTGTSTNQTIKLPTTSVPAGYECTIINKTSSGTVTVQASDATTIGTLTASQVGKYTALVATPTTSSQWVTGGNLEGVTIGGTSVSPAVNALAMKTNSLAQTNGVLILSGSTSKPWLNQSVAVGGTLSTQGVANQIAVADGLNSGNNYFIGLNVLDTVTTGAVGLRNAINGFVNVTGAGTNTQGQAQYVGVQGRANLATTALGGTPTTPIGAAWGGWFSAGAGVGTDFYQVFGVEIDLAVASGASVQGKVGLNIGLVSGDQERGVIADAAIGVIKQQFVTTSFKNGIVFGGDLGSVNTPDNSYILWPFDTDSTIIYCGSHGVGTNNAAIGIDFTNVTFADCAIKTGPAPIQMGAMASPPATPASGKGKLYIASDGSLHYLGPTTDTQLAPA